MCFEMVKLFWNNRDFMGVIKYNVVYSKRGRSIQLNVLDKEIDVKKCLISNCEIKE